jgi:hypothetical protein
VQTIVNQTEETGKGEPHRTLSFAANFTLVAVIIPCKCGTKLHGRAGAGAMLGLTRLPTQIRIPGSGFYMHSRHRLPEPTSRVPLPGRQQGKRAIPTKGRPSHAPASVESLSLSFSGEAWHSLPGQPVTALLVIPSPASWPRGGLCCTPRVRSPRLECRTT